MFCGQIWFFLGVNLGIMLQWNLGGRLYKKILSLVEFLWYLICLFVFKWLFNFYEFELGFLGFDLELDLSILELKVFIYLKMLEGLEVNFVFERNLVRRKR